jgi:PAS domain S-box-containing protein
VTDKYNLQRDIRRTKEKLKYALRGSEIGVWEFNIHTNELYFSDEWKKIVGYEPTDAKNAFEQWAQVVHPEDKDFTLKSVNDCINNLSAGFKIEYRLLKNGGVIWIAAVGKVMSRLEDGSPKRFSGTIRDITDKKKIEELLKANEEKFRNAFHYSASGIGLVSMQGDFVDVNPALCKMLGYTRKELLNMNFQVITHPEDFQNNLQNRIRLTNHEIDSYRTEKRYFHKNGSIVWALLTVSVVKKDNEPECFITQVINISETKDLITQLEAKNVQLNITTLDLKNKVEQLEEFNKIVAHNLRGPVGNIVQMGRLMDEDRSSSEVLIPMLREASVSLDGTLKQLVNILELKLNDKIAFDQCLLEVIISKIKSMLNVQIEKEKIGFETDLKVKEIQYPVIYLESILYNLISNAIKYRRKAVKSVIKINTYVESNRTVLEVSDNGLGIDLKRYGSQVFKLNKIFHSGYDSKGLGLFILKNQIETLGGNITVTSEPNKGTTFKVFFKEN